MSTVDTTIDFVSDLRGSLAAMRAGARAAAQAEEDERQAARARFAETSEAAEGLALDVFRPLLENFKAAMIAENVLREGRAYDSRIREEHTAAGVHRVRFRAQGAKRGGPLYHVSVAAAATETGAIELRAECFHDLPPSYRHDPAPQPLAALRPETITPDGNYRDAARWWCASILKQCGELLMAAIVLPACP